MFEVFSIVFSLLWYLFGVSRLSGYTKKINLRGAAWVGVIPGLNKQSGWKTFGQSTQILKWNVSTELQQCQRQQQLLFSATPLGHDTETVFLNKHCFNRIRRFLCQKTHISLISIETSQQCVVNRNFDEKQNFVSFVTLMFNCPRWSRNEPRLGLWGQKL